MYSLKIEENLTKLKTLLLLVLFACTNKQFSQELQRIDIESAIDKKSVPIQLSDYIANINYVPLETNINCLISENKKLSASENVIIVKTLDECFAFDKHTGAFLNKIGTKGKGPEEYLHTTGLINPTDKSVYLMGAYLQKYRFDGTYLKSLKGTKEESWINPNSGISNHTYLNDNLVGYLQNYHGAERRKLIVFNQEGDVVTTFPNYKYLEQPSGNWSMSLNDSQFYHFDGNLFFKEEYSDTLFQVTREKLIPKKILYLGKYQQSFEDKWGTKDGKIKLFSFIRHICESKSFLFFELMHPGKLYQGIYNKKTKELRLADKNTEVINDIDGFLPFTPLTISTDGYLLSYIEAYKVVDWFKANTDKAKTLPSSLQKLKNIKESDNPVLVIAKTKE